MDEKILKTAIEQAVEKLGDMIRERDELRERLKALESEIPLLAEKINALANLIGDPAMIESGMKDFLDEVATMGLTDAVRAGLKSTHIPRTVIEIRNWLRSRNYDLSKYANEVATLHTVLKRLVENSGEVEEVEKEGRKAYRWKRGKRAAPLVKLPKIKIKGVG